MFSNPPTSADKQHDKEIKWRPLGSLLSLREEITNISHSNNPQAAPATAPPPPATHPTYGGLSEQEAIAKYRAMGLLKKVDDLRLSPRAANCLHNAKIQYVGDLVTKTEKQLQQIRAFGLHCMEEIKLTLGRMGLSLETHLRYWPLPNLDVLAEEYERTSAYETAFAQEEPLKKAFMRSLKQVVGKRNRAIMEARLGVYGAPMTLADVGNEWNLTRERVRQIQGNLIQKIQKEEPWCKALCMRLRALMQSSTEPLFLDEIAQEDPWFAGFENNLILLENLIVEFSGLHPTILDFDQRGGLKASPFNSISYEEKGVMEWVMPAEGTPYTPIWKTQQYRLVFGLQHVAECVSVNTDTVACWITEEALPPPIFMATQKQYRVYLLEEVRIMMEELDDAQHTYGAADTARRERIFARMDACRKALLRTG